MASTGIEVRHARPCPAAQDPDARCKCKPTYRASVWSKRDNARIRKSFPTPGAAKAWREDTSGALRRNEQRAPTGETVRAAWEAFGIKMKKGEVRSRSGKPYKPSVIRSYSEAMRLRVLPEFGAHKLSAVTIEDVEEFVDRLVGEGLHASTVRNTINPLRVLYRHHRRRAPVNPCVGIGNLPLVRNSKERKVADREEAEQLLEALPPDLCTLYSVAYYGGLRRGEVLALDWSAIDFDANEIHVTRAWDPGAKEFVDPKSDAGTRDVPMPNVLAARLRDHRMRTGRRFGLVFSADGSRPLDPRGIGRRAATAWKAAGLEPLGLQDSRHSFTSFLHDRATPDVVLAEMLGHADGGRLIHERYGHPLRGAKHVAAARFDVAGAGQSAGQ
jgi:integrase